MADAKQARRSAEENIKKLTVQNKDVSSVLSELQQLSKTRLAALQKLDATAKGLKPKPAATAMIGDSPELRKLMQSSRLLETSSKYESTRKEVEGALSLRGQQRVMLNKLLEYTSVNLEQHTGGRAGEAYDSRRDNRLIYQALKGLQIEAPVEQAGKAIDKVPNRSKPLTEKSRLGDLSAHLEDAKAALAAIEQAVKAMDQFVAAFDDGAKLALKGFAEADSATTA